MKNSRAKAYSIVYFLYYGFMAFEITFLFIYCRGLGFSPFEIAAVSIASISAVLIGSPMALEAEHVKISARKLSLLLIALCIGTFAFLFIAQSFLSVLIIIFFSKVFYRGAGVIIDASAIRDAAKGRIHFEYVRTFGSLGFMGAAFLLGLGYDIYGSDVIVTIGFTILVCIFFSLFVLLQYLPGETGKHRARSNKTEKIRPENLIPFAILLIVMAISWASHAPLTVYFSLYLEDLGWTGSEISMAWNVGVVAEIIFFLCLPFIRRRLDLSLASILRFSLFMTAVRWLILWYSDSTTMIMASQVLHAFAFAGCYLASVKLTYELLPEGLKDRGQGVLLSFGMGFGNLAGRIGYGLYAEVLPSYSEVYLLFSSAAVLALIAFILSFAIRVRGS